MTIRKMKQIAEIIRTERMDSVIAYEIQKIVGDEEYNHIIDFIITIKDVYKNTRTLDIYAPVHRDKYKVILPYTSIFMESKIVLKRAQDFYYFSKWLYRNTTKREYQAIMDIVISVVEAYRITKY